MVVREWRRKIKKDLMMKELITITSRDRVEGVTMARRTLAGWTGRNFGVCQTDLVRGAQGLSILDI